MIAKRLTAPYEHRRSPHWLKMKCEASQELVVGGFTDPQGTRAGLGALLVGYFEGDDSLAAAYAVRARPGAPVSAPCTWEEIESGAVGPRTFTLRGMADRIAVVGDLWSGMRRRRRSLTRPAGRLGRLRQSG